LIYASTDNRAVQKLNGYERLATGCYKPLRFFARQHPTVATVTGFAQW